LTIGKPIGTVITMKINWNKTIRPTQLQPKLYSVVNSLASQHDYKVIIGKNNQPLCVLLSYSLLKNIELDDNKKAAHTQLIQDMKKYYSSLSDDETELLNDTIDDGYEY
jgi:hypothetical protein